MKKKKTHAPAKSATAGAAAYSPRHFTWEKFRARQSEVHLVLSRYHMRHLLEIYRYADGDIVLLMVLGEIAHHNVAGMFSQGNLKIAPEAFRGIMVKDGRISSLLSCNAHSIHLATGIPRETVRRKVAALLKRGWIAQREDGGYVVLSACAQYFGAEQTPADADALLDAADSLRKVLGSSR